MCHWHYLPPPWCLRSSLWITGLAISNKCWKAASGEKCSSTNTLTKIPCGLTDNHCNLSINNGLIISLHSLFFFFISYTDENWIHISFIYFLEKKPAVQLKQYQDSSCGFADRAGRMVEECCLCDGGTLRGWVGRSSDLREGWKDHVKFDRVKSFCTIVFDDGHNSHLPMQDVGHGWETSPFSWGCWQQRSGTKRPVGTMRHQACWRILRAERLSPFCEQGKARGHTIYPHMILTALSHVMSTIPTPFNNTWS